MDIGKQLIQIRKEHQLTQETFGALFHVTRQTVSNWENGKNYPDLQTLITISNHFEISLDTLLKGDLTMIKTIDKERLLGTLKQEQLRTDRLISAGSGMLFSCLFSPDSVIRTIIIITSLIMLFIGLWNKTKYDKKVLSCLTDMKS